MADFQDITVNGNLRLIHEPLLDPPLQINVGGTGVMKKKMSEYALLKTDLHHTKWEELSRIDNVYTELAVSTSTNADNAETVTRLIDYDVPSSELRLQASGSVVTSNVRPATMVSVSSTVVRVCPLQDGTITVGNSTAWGGWTLKYDGDYSTDEYTINIV